MSKNDISIEQLSSETQNKVLEFDSLYSEAMQYGINESEKQELLNLSQHIADSIVQEFQQKESSGSGLGILAVIGLSVATALGINHFMRN